MSAPDAPADRTSPEYRAHIRKLAETAAGFLAKQMEQ